MYKILQSAALIALVAILTNVCADYAADDAQLMLVQGAGLALLLALGGDALRSLWRS